MKELDYIVAGDVKTVVAAESVLRDICPQNNPHIPDDEYRQVMRYLRSWRMALFNNISTEE